MPVNINPMWPTEEYAIKDFRSGWRMQINLVTTAPVMEILINIGVDRFTIFWNVILIRANP